MRRVLASHRLVRPVLLVLLVAGPLASCSEPSHLGASCADRLDFEGRGYSGATGNNTLPDELPDDHLLGRATLAGCDDGSQGGSDDGTPVDAYRLDGVDPTVAVAGVLDGSLRLYVAQGVDPCTVRYAVCSGGGY